MMQRRLIFTDAQADQAAEVGGPSPFKEESMREAPRDETRSYSEATSAPGGCCGCLLRVLWYPKESPGRCCSPQLLGSDLSSWCVLRVPSDGAVVSERESWSLLFTSATRKRPLLLVCAAGAFGWCCSIRKRVLVAAVHLSYSEATSPPGVCCGCFRMVL